MGTLNGLLLLSLLLASVTLCLADATFHVAGSVECTDCVSNNFKASQAFAGLHVSIDCKLPNGKVTTFGAGELAEDGSFKIALPKEVVNGDKLKHDCFAQLHNAAASPCAGAGTTIDIVVKSLGKGKIAFALDKNLKFSSASCTSKFLWPYFKHPPLPKLPLPPLQSFGHPWFSHPPIFKSPVPSVPKSPVIVKPPVKPPVYKPPTPIYKPPSPAYKPPTPTVKPPTPVYKPPPVTKPIHPPFPFHHPLPPFPKIFTPHPFPPFPKITKPPFPKFPTHPLPPFPKIAFPPHPSIFHHPKLGFFTPPAVPRS